MSKDIQKPERPDSAELSGLAQATRENQLSEIRQIPEVRAARFAARSISLRVEIEDYEKRQREGKLVQGVDFLHPVCMNRGKPFDRATGKPAPLPDNWEEIERAELVFQGLIPSRYIRPTDKINPEKPPSPL